MNSAVIVAGILWLSLTAYAVLAGADFGGGVWDIMATGPRAERQRSSIASAMGPVWEANHVWLIFLIVGLFTAFPSVFGVIGLALFIPFTVALVGIILRGAAFAFRAHGEEAVGPLAPWGVVFAGGSIIAPFALGSGAAAVASASIHAPRGVLSSGFVTGWNSLFAIDVGCFSVALCAYLAATYLMVESEADPDLESDFRVRATGAALASGAFGLAGIGLAYLQARPLFDALTGRGLPLLALALLNGPVALFAVRRGRPRLARIAVAGQVVFVLWALAVGQWPYLIPPDLTIEGSASPPSVLDAMLVVIVVGMVLVLPSLYLLFRVFKGRNPAGNEQAK